MFNTLKNLFAGTPEPDFADLIQNGGHVLDVRSKEEFASGHVQGATNIPLGSLPGQLPRWDKKKPIITCCASGMRSASARNILMQNGYEEVYNGGGWSSLAHKLKG